MKKPLSHGKNYIIFENITLYFYHDKRVLSQYQYNKISALLRKTLKPVKSLLKSQVFPKNDVFKKAEEININLMFCGVQKIQKLNRNHRNKNKVTDVLSFPGYEDFRESSNNSFVHTIMELGDIFICAKQAQKQAIEHNIDFYSECIHLFIHGLLHLLGFDHEISLDEEKIMEKYEAKLIKQIKKPSR